MTALRPPIRVFLVEDQEWLRNIEVQVLSMQDGIEVCGSAGTGEQALAELPPNTQVILVDLHLPGLGGLGVVQALKETRPDIGAIVLSARPAIEAAASALDAGAVAYVEKGDVPALLEAIHACRQDP